MISCFVSFKMLLEIPLPLQVINFYVFIRFWCRKAKKTKNPFYFELNANMLTVSAANKCNPRETVADLTVTSPGRYRHCGE